MDCSKAVLRPRAMRAHRALALVLGSLVTSNALAEGPDLLEQPFTISLGTYILETDTTLRLDASNENTGTKFNWEGVFDKGDVNRFRIDGAWRFSDKHKLRGMWFDFSRTRTRTSDFEIEWGDEVFPASTELTGRNRFSIFELAYEYSFLKRDNLELTGTAGLHYTQFKSELSATLNTGSGSGTREASDTAKLDVPLPVFGVRALWRMGGDFWLDGAVQYFALSYDDYDGKIIDTRAAVFWQPRDWVGIGLGYNRFAIDVTLEKNNYRGTFDWVYEGPQIFYSVAF